MIPESFINDSISINKDVETSLTYKITTENIQGYTDNLAALQQAIYKVLNTEKYEYPVYSFSYGIDMESLIGKDLAYVRIELKRRIQECLLQDERIQLVDNFQFTANGDLLVCTFSVTSIFGDLAITREVIT